ncbi:MAG: type I-C CRISPR-associated protein Cas5, partial [Bacteroidota bacterium]|nr:type I-C CRISPR-associated protein Cas5 [Bacteroidota bacterium]
FKRRASKGKCIYQPYLGCREFPAYFEYLENGDQNHDTLPVDMDNLGWMLYDVFDLDHFYEKENWKEENHNLCISLFKPVVKNGVMIVPEYSSNEVYKGVRRER